jgi:hypothetical protein
MAAKKKRRFGPSPALKKARAQLATSRRALSSTRAKAKAGGYGSKLEQTGATVAGGAISGVIMAKYPLVGGMDTRLVVGGAAVAAGMWGVKGKTGAYLSCAGNGLLACSVSDYVQAMV